MTAVGQLETFPALSRMSAAGGEADVARMWSELLLLAKSRSQRGAPDSRDSRTPAMA